AGAGGSQVHGELLVAAEGDQGGDRDRAANSAGEAGARPDLTPGVARDQVLELRSEVGRPRHGAVDVGVAEDGAADLHPVLVAHVACPRYAASARSTRCPAAPR